MSQIEWTPEMSVGHADLDEQHQTLLDLYNQFDAASAQGKGSRAVAGLLEQLVKYTEVHFAAEEQVMADAHYTGLEHHKALHGQLIDKLEGFQADLASGRRFTADFRRFLGYWWQSHILEHDREYGRALFGALDPDEPH